MQKMALRQDHDSPLSLHSLSPPHISCRIENHFFSCAAPRQKNMVYLRRKGVLAPAGDTGSSPDDALSLGQHRLTRATMMSPQWVPSSQTACSLHGGQPSAQSPSKSLRRPKGPCHPHLWGLASRASLLTSPPDSPGPERTFSAFPSALPTPAPPGPGLSQPSPVPPVFHSAQS